MDAEERVEELEAVLEDVTAERDDAERRAAEAEAEVRRLRARRTVLARQSPVVRRLRRWANGEHAGTDVAADVRALLESYDALLAMRDAPPATPGGA